MAPYVRFLSSIEPPTPSSSHEPIHRFSPTLPLSPSYLFSSPPSCSISSSEQTLGTRGMKVKHRSSFGSPGRELKNK
ncbi:hypothetical protein E2C01_070668 [Portunus trituberculatus]|uniref:Uncharacterized protein n=1 Tax=Portunus trituberculatus TaxID=210409 RepID=A0A5B7HTB7_PORTR|nr:hypothetical protein [Portunus trituberculatus]